MNIELMEIDLRILEVIMQLADAKEPITYRSIICNKSSNKSRINPVAISRSIGRLVEAGMISVERRKARTIRPTVRFIPASML